MFVPRAAQRGVGPLKPMGLNVDNLFVKSTKREALIAALRDVLPKSKWKVALSDPNQGWIQIIESRETTPPDVAQELSRKLTCVVICAQLYEVAGEIAWNVFENGTNTESFQSADCDDFHLEIHDALRKAGVPFQMLMFREVVTRKEGWVFEQAKE